MTVKHSNPCVQSTGEAVADALTKLESLFQPEMQLAFLAFDPALPEKDMCISAGDPDDLLAAAQRVVVREAARGVGK